MSVMSVQRSFRGLAAILPMSARSSRHLKVRPGLRIPLLTTVLAALCFTGQAQAQSCTISFGDVTGLSMLDSEQALGFMAPADGIGVWYLNRCASSKTWFNLDENPPGSYPSGTTIGHMHIPFNDPTITCFLITPAYPNGVFGRPANNAQGCTAIDPIHESRTVTTHQADQKLRIRIFPVFLSNAPPKRFVVQSLDVLGNGTGPVDVVIQDTAGKWWQYANIPPKHHAILNGAITAQQAFVRSSVTSDQRFEVDNIAVAIAPEAQASIEPGPSGGCRDGADCRSKQGDLSVSTLEAYLTRLTESEGGQGDIPGRVTLDLPAMTIAASPALMESPRTAHTHDMSDREQMLNDIMRLDGRERQLLMLDYLMSLQDVPRDQQIVGKLKLAALFIR